MAAGSASGIRNASVSACTLPIRPAPMIPIVSLLSGIVVLDGAQVLAIAAGALPRRTHARQYVLLHEDVAVILGLSEPAQDGREVNAALPKLAEYTVPQGCKVVPFSGAGVFRDLRLAVLQVDIPHAFPEAAEAAHHVPVAGSIGVVAGVEHESDKPRVRQLEETGNF